MIVLWYLSTDPRLPQLPSLLGWDKLQHTVAYGVLCALFWVGFKRGSALSRLSAIFLSIGCTISYGAVDEIHQKFIPGRLGSIYDFAADCVGAGVAVLLVSAMSQSETG